MKIFVMPDLKWGNISIPGGWQIGVPEISLDSDMMSAARAARVPAMQVTEAMQYLFEQGMAKSVRDFVRYWSRRYAKMFPDLHDSKTGEVRGFDPVDLMRFWLPGTKAWGKDNLEVRQALGEYAWMARWMERRDRDE